MINPIIASNAGVGMPITPPCASNEECRSDLAGFAERFEKSVGGIVTMVTQSSVLARRKPSLCPREDAETFAGEASNPNGLTYLQRPGSASEALVGGCSLVSCN